MERRMYRIGRTAWSWRGLEAACELVQKLSEVETVSKEEIKHKNKGRGPKGQSYCEEKGIKSA